MKKILNFRPTLFIVIGLILFLFCTRLFVLGNGALGVALIASFLIFSIILCLVYGKNGLIKRNLIFLFILLIICSITALNYSVKVNKFNNSSLNGNYYTVEGKIIDVVEGLNYKQYIIDDVSVKGIYTGKLEHKLKLNVGGYCDADVGDIISFFGAISDNGITYDGKYSASNVAKNIRYYSYVTSNEVGVLRRERNVFESINIFIRDTLRKGMEPDSFAVAYSLLCGNSDYTDTDVLEGYRLAGVAHIFAVSGLHVGFLSAILFFLFSRLRINEYLKLFIIVLVLFLYSGVCGFSASSLRATLMFAVIRLVTLAGYRYDSISSTSIAFIIIATFSPSQVFTAGFILSFGVVYGIAILSGEFSRLFKFLPNKLASSLSVVLSAQIYFIPLSLATFGEFSTIAIVINLIFIPLVGVIFSLTFFTTIIGGLYGIERIILFIPNYVFKIINFLINAFDYKIFIIGGFVFGPFVLVYYALTFVLSGLVNVKRLAKLLVCLSLTVVLSVGTVWFNGSTHTTPTYCVIGEKEFCVTVIMAEENVMIVSRSDYNASTKRLKTFSQKNKLTVLDKVIITNSFNETDTHSFVSGLIGTFKVNKVYYPDNDEIYKSVLTKSFIDIEFNEYSLDYPEQVLCDGVTSLNYGKVVNVNVNDRKFAVFSEIGETINGYNGMDLVGLDVAVCYDYVNKIDFEYQPRIAISYLPCYNYVDGNSNGYYK